MNDLQLTDKRAKPRDPRSLVRWAAIVIGIIAGVVYAAAGMQSFFVATDWRGVVGAVLGVMPLLPLTVLGIFKPRLAAYGMFASAFVFLACEAQPSDLHGTSVLGDVLVFLILLVPGCLVAGMLLYASCDDGGPNHREGEAAARGSCGNAHQRRGLGRDMRKRSVQRASAERKKRARWAAIVFGALLGAYGALWGWHWVILSARQGDWWSVIGIGTESLTLLPLCVLAAFKPRTAAYGVLGSLALVLAYDGYLSTTPPFTSKETAARVIFTCFETFPFTLIAGLLFYATCRGDAGNERS